MHKQKTQRNIFIICSTFIPVILLITFTYYPALKLVYYSFTDSDGVVKNPGFVGLYNWTKLFATGEAFSTLGHSVYYMIGGIVQNSAALLMAVLLNNRKMRGRNILRGIMVLPFILNGTAVSYMFRYMYDFTKGPLNKFLNVLHLPPVSWLGSAQIVNWSLAFVCLWRYTGYLMVIYLAGLQAIREEYYEAAQIDGASGWQQFRYVTLPQITGVIKLQMFLNISGAVNIFDIPFIITEGGPLNASKTLSMRANELAFTYHNYGLASAYGVFCTVAIIIIYIVQDKILYRKEADA